MTKELHEDPWIQVFALLALLSGALTLHGLTQRIIGIGAGRPSPAPSGPRPTGAGAEDASESRMKILAPGGSLAEVGAPSLTGQPSLEDVLLGRSPTASSPAAAPLLGGTGVQKTIHAKTPGKWIVDAAKGADSDTDDLSAALASVSAGDSVKVRPGTYKGNLLIDKPVTVEGLGSSPGAVIVQGSQSQTVSVAGAAVVLRNLTVKHDGLKATRAILNQKGTLTLDRVTIQSAPGALGVETRGGIVDATVLKVESSYVGVGGSEGATLKLPSTEISAPEAGGVALARGRLLELSASTIRGSGGHGILLYEGAEAKVVKTSVSGSKNCALSIQNASAKLDGVRFNDNDCGVIFPAGGSLESDRGDFGMNPKGPLSYQGFSRPHRGQGTANRPALALGQSPVSTRARGRP